MTTWKIFHNASCTKCCGTLALLREHGIEPEIVSYLENPPSEAEILQLLGLLGGSPSKIIRTKEPVFATLSISLEDPNAVAKAIAQHPELLERPIVTDGKRAVIGRPPENVLPLLK